MALCYSILFKFKNNMNLTTIMVLLLHFPILCPFFAVVIGNNAICCECVCVCVACLFMGVNQFG